MLNWLYEAIAQIVLFFHRVLTPVFGEDDGTTWALAIVLLTVTVRLLLFPLFVKQIKSQRAMQALAPRMKELQKKHQGDRETRNRELMGLYKAHGANPVAGCLPLLLQLPVFFALFAVLREIQPRLVNGVYIYEADNGISEELVESAARAKIFEVPISSAFNSSTELLTELSATPGPVKILAVIMIVLMGASTFITQKQMMSRSGPLEGQQAQIQKILLYVLPFSFAIFGFQFPIGVLLYWLTTNLWSMGQQFFIIRRMPPVLGGTGDTSTPKTSNGTGARSIGKGDSSKQDRPTAVANGSRRGANGRSSAFPGIGTNTSGKTGGTAGSSEAARPPAEAGQTPRSGSSAPGPARPAPAAVGARRPTGSRKNKSQRRGGRR